MPSVYKEINAHNSNFVYYFYFHHSHIGWQEWNLSPSWVAGCKTNTPYRCAIVCTQGVHLKTWKSHESLPQLKNLWLNIFFALWERTPALRLHGSGLWAGWMGGAGPILRLAVMWGGQVDSVAAVRKRRVGPQVPGLHITTLFPPSKPFSPPSLSIT